MKKLNVAIIGGGYSNEREISLLTSRQIAQTLPRGKYNASFIEITQEKQWVLHDGSFFSLPQSSQKGKKLAVFDGAHALKGDSFLFAKKNAIDVVFVALHGKNGEDGKVQAVLELMGVPYTGSGVLASALGMNKSKCLEFVDKKGISIPRHIVVFKNRFVSKVLQKEVSRRVGYPCVVKPNESGSSIGVSIVESEKGLSSALRAAFQEDSVVLIEEYIRGREFTCGVLGNTNQGNVVALPSVEIVTPGSKFFGYKEKYFSKTVQEICPAKINKKLTEKIKQIAKNIHEMLGCDGLTRSDFILSSQDKQLYFLEINTIPGQTKASLCPKEARALGISFARFLEMQIRLALKKRQ